MLQKGFLGFKSLLIIFILTIGFTACHSSKKGNTAVTKEAANDSLAQIAITHQKIDSMLKMLNQEIRKDINNPELYYKRALIYAKNHTLKHAVADLNRAIKLDSTNSKYYLTEADYLLTLRKPKLEKQTLERAVKNIPNCDSCYAKLGELALLSKAYGKVYQFTDKALRINKYNAYAYFLKGVAHLQTGDTATAKSSLLTAVEQNPKSFRALMQLGVLCTIEHDSSAILYFQRALNLKPNNRQAMYNEAMFYQTHYQYNKAISIYTKMTKLFPKFRDAYFNMGYINMVYLQTFQVAVGYFNQAIAVAPKFYKAYFNRGFCYEKLGNNKKALEDYKASLKINPQYTRAAKAVDRMEGN